MHFPWTQPWPWPQPWELTSVMSRTQSGYEYTNISHMSHEASVHTHTVCVKEMTAAVTQTIPLDTSRGRAWGFVHLRTAIIPHIICDNGVQVCVCQCCEGIEKACDWGTRRLSECIPYGQHMIPQETWTSALNDTSEDHQARMLPRGGGHDSWFQMISAYIDSIENAKEIFEVI